MTLLEGKNVILTGASRGLGRTIAKTFWSKGANLLLIARSKELLSDLRTELKRDSRAGQSVEIIALDLSESGIVQKLISKAHSFWNGLDVLINNAAIIGPIGRSWDVDYEEWRATIQLNLLLPVELSIACVSWMKEQSHGKIINLSGGGATMPRNRFSAYSTAKAALVRFSETLAEEVREMNIQVNCVAPGTMKTDMQQIVKNAGPAKAGAQEYSDAIQAEELEDSGTERAAELCAFLASSAGDRITGRLISAVWDPWIKLPDHAEELAGSDVYTLRRIVPSDRGKKWE